MSATARFTAWAERDDNDLGLWLRHPLGSTRWHVANGVSELGAALSRLGHRIHDDIPSDYHQGYRDAEEMVELVESVRRESNRKGAIRLLEKWCVDTGPETLAKFGLADKAPLPCDAWDSCPTPGHQHA